MAVSSLHEDLLGLVRERPAFAAEVLAKLVDVHVPRFANARVTDSALNEAPIELRADAVVLLDDERPVFGIVVEAQLQRDGRKEYTWPAYAAIARARHECPFVVIVLTASSQVARWAGETIQLGCGTFRPIVLGPEQIPKVTDPAQAIRDPELALLSVMTHGAGDDIDTAVRIATATSEILLHDEVKKTMNKALYLGLIERSLSAAAKEKFRMQPETRRLYSDSYYEGMEAGEAKGEARGRIQAVLKILTKRGLAVSDEQRRRIAACADLAVLDGWIDRAFSVTSADELLG
jgi:hypothetical protein